MSQSGNRVPVIFIIGKRLQSPTLLTRLGPHSAGKRTQCERLSRAFGIVTKGCAEDEEDIGTSVVDFVTNTAIAEDDWVAVYGFPQTLQQLEFFEQIASSESVCLSR